MEHTLLPLLLLAAASVVTPAPLDTSYIRIRVYNEAWSFHTPIPDFAGDGEWLMESAIRTGQRVAQVPQLICLDGVTLYPFTTAAFEQHMAQRLCRLELQDTTNSEYTRCYRCPA